MEPIHNKPIVLAYYLPQYHPFPENDVWWGKGFTEWTNVGKTQPLFKGHYQPKVPADLGYYDLRLPQVAEEQADLARRAGITGFCYWHYWFGNGKELLEMPFRRAVNTGKPDFPFCLGWAAEGWLKKTWNKDFTEKGIWLIKQEFPGSEDDEKHFYAYLDAFKDKRYIRIGGRPFFLLYGISNFPDIKSFMDHWNALIRKEGVADGFYFVACAKTMDEFNNLDTTIFDAVTIGNLFRSKYYAKGLHRKGLRFVERIIGNLRKRPIMIDYNEIIRNSWDENCERDDFLPCLVPNWDHTPRSGYTGSMFYNCNPESWSRMCERILPRVMKKKNKIVMLKSWNEWGEGNYMEPDIRYGTAYIDTLRKWIDRVSTYTPALDKDQK